MVTRYADIGKIHLGPFLRDEAEISTPDKWFVIICEEKCEETFIGDLDPPEL